MEGSPQLTDIIEPGVPILMAATPLCLAYVQIRVDKQAPGVCLLDYVVPYLETGGLGRPAGIMSDNFIGDSGAVFDAKRHYHRNLQGDVLAITVVDLVHHLEGVSPIEL